MARRVVNGNTHSEDGWPLVDQGSCTWVEIPGAEHVTLQIQNGPPIQVMRAFAADYNQHVEPLRDRDSACWTPSNSVLGQPGRNNGSNHLGGTGMDLNWDGPDGKTFRLGISKERAYPGDKARKLDELLEWYEDNIFCGGEWSIRDWMHFQMGGDTYDSRNDRPSQKVLDFIARKIRPDGFSTYKRGETPVPETNLAQLLADAMDNIPGVDYSKMLPYVQRCLVESECNNNNRIAMWMAQIGHESVGLKYMKEIGDAAYFAKYNNRTDLGNGPNDGPRYPGRGPIQVTGRSNYRKLSAWAFSKGYVATPTFFEDHPEQLERLEYAFLGAIWYWTVAQPKINEYCDRGDVENVSKLINAPAWVGTNKRAHGIEKRIYLWNQAKTMNLMPLLEEDWMAGVDVERLNRAIDKILGGETMPAQWDSRGMFVPVGEPGTNVDDTVGMLLNTDGNAWNLMMVLGAFLGVERDAQAIRDNAAGLFPENSFVAKNPWLRERSVEFAKKIEPLIGLLSPEGLGFTMESDNAD